MTYFENQKRLGLIFTEAHMRPDGSDLSMEPSGGGNATPYFNQFGAIQWDRRKRRYRTYEEQQEYMVQIAAHQPITLKEANKRREN